MAYENGGRDQAVEDVNTIKLFYRFKMSITRSAMDPEAYYGILPAISSDSLLAILVYNTIKLGQQQNPWLIYSSIIS